MLVIGNEILSGRTRDVNLAYIGGELAAMGIPLREARVVADVDPEIVAAVRTLSGSYTYVFTTGGIGPTHDDITSAAIAAAFGVKLEVREEAVLMLRRFYGADELSAPRLKMATVPEGSTLIDNPVSGAPGFRIGNVFVMAGVPPIMRAMFDTLRPQLAGGPPILSRTVTAPIGESRIAESLTAIQQRHTDVAIGSYPFARQNRVAVNIVSRGTDAARLEAVSLEIADALRGLGVGDDDIVIA
jgi:molybdopterin-biosynthesis enzyme MoeA-like protein